MAGWGAASMASAPWSSISLHRRRHSAKSPNIALYTCCGIAAAATLHQLTLDQFAAAQDSPVD